MKKVIITGAGGFVGSALTRKFVENGFEVIAISRSFKSASFPNSKNIKMIQVEIADAKHILSMIPEGDYEAFYHLAWRGVNGTEKADPFVQLNNIQMSLTCAEAAVALKCKKFLCAGTIAEQAVNSLPNLNSVSGGMMYSSAKYCTRILLETWCKNKGLDFVWMQFSNIYGPGNVTGNLIDYTIRNIVSGKTAEFGPANQPYDFIYIDDLIEAVYKLTVLNTSQNHYFIGSGTPRLLKEYLVEIGNIVGYPELIKIGIRPDDGIRYSWEMFDASMLAEDIGEYVTHRFEQGVQLTLSGRR